MTESLTTDRVRRFWAELQSRFAERSAAETRLTAERTAEGDSLRLRHEAAIQAIAERRRAERAAAEADHAESLRTIAERFDTAMREAKTQHARLREETLEQFQADQERIEQSATEARWTIDAVHEANVKKARMAWDHARRELADRAQAALSIKQSALDRHREWSLTPAGIGQMSDAPGGDDSLPRIDECLAAARQHLAEFQRLWAPRLLAGDRWLWMIFALWAVIAASGWFMPVWYYGLIAATVAAILLGMIAPWLLSRRASSAARRIGAPLFQSVAEVDRLCASAEFTAEDAFKQSVAESARRQRDEISRAEVEHSTRLDQNRRRTDETIAQADARWNEQSAQLTAERTAAQADAESRYRARLNEIESRAADEIRSAETDFQAQNRTLRERLNAAEQTLIADWCAGRDHLISEWLAIEAENDRLFPAWPQPLLQRDPPREAPRCLRFGSLAVDVTALDGGQPRDPRLPPMTPERLALPALLPFPTHASTLLHCTEAARSDGVAVLQSLMLRFLTAVPPGKVRFTIIDPVGLGENFASFMHLADFDEQLIAGRIWTEPGQIERRLLDLTAHMENVIQKYLRNQYKSIEDYNAAAGEVAEPYRILVVANFPVNFSAETARRLVSIASSGAACGVFVLASVDAKQNLPQGFDLADLEAACENLSWSGERFAWEDADFGALPLTIDSPPEPNAVAQIVRLVGERARQAGRVEVDFGFIEPPREQWWTADSRGGIRVALGRAGATKRQHLHLGVGTAQHALVAGKTGSGKSTLLHALITNLALHYSPEELELYLIDFKKGVEFKTYATHLLPHARVIAIESEREFGLSVLQRLDAELKRRGDLFRDAGVQDIASYRDKRESRAGSDSSARLPRILLIVDEFQEFFVEDDRLAQDAALLLDRLVRQGRAFGLHVLLGSQTLGGAYSLARSTIDQMAVRIALQCSEADANLILAKDNNAARLLSRPGEAIYNDANGLMEGNDIFQVVWLPEERRERVLSEVHALAERRQWQSPAPTIVFEGNVPADIAGNARLRRLIESDAPRPRREQFAWLGEALAIKDPTAAVFRRQSGSNLLIIGQNADAARAIVAASAVSLLVQQPSGAIDDPPILLLDGSPADDPLVEWFASLAEQFPGGLVSRSWRDGGDDWKRLMEELERRKADPGAIGTSKYLIVYGLHRFRDLRRGDDDFGFGRRNEGSTASPADQFTELIREGPALGIHAIVWCDTLANVQRALDRRDLREFEQRVLFQMGVTDSSTLIDSPAASRLGLNRALYAAEELSAPEKFRPYRLPPDDWLAEAGARWLRKKSAPRLDAAPAP